MSFLSNITSSISHIAEEALHDIQNVAGGKLAETVKSLATHGLDTVMKDLGHGLESIGKSFLHAGQDMVKHFSHPGAIHAPKHPKHPVKHPATPVKTPTTPTTTAPTQGGVTSPAAPTGYAPLPTAPTQGGDTGVIGGSTSAGSASDTLNKAKTAEQGSDQSLDAILSDPTMSLETKILSILLKLQKDKKQEVYDHLTKGTALKKQASAAGVGAEAGSAQEKNKTDLEADASREMQLMQQSASELNELTSMTTNMMKLQHDMKMATVQNLR